MPINIISKHAKRTVGPNDHLTHDLGFDSLDRIDLVMDIEDVFDLTISDEQTQNLQTVQDVLDLVPA